MTAKDKKNICKKMKLVKKISNMKSCKHKKCQIQTSTKVQYSKVKIRGAIETDLNTEAKPKPMAIDLQAKATTKEIEDSLGFVRRVVVVEGFHGDPLARRLRETPFPPFPSCCVFFLHTFHHALFSISNSRFFNYGPIILWAEIEAQ